MLGFLRNGTLCGIKLLLGIQSENRNNTFLICVIRYLMDVVDEYIMPFPLVFTSKKMLLDFTVVDIY